MISSTVEDYLKRLYLLEHEPSPAEADRPGGPDGLVPTGQLAAAMEVAPGTATSMVKALADSGLVEHEPRRGVRLTPSGRRLALHVVRRHRLVELFLVRIIGLSWSEVHEEAERLEHAISDKVLDRIDDLLGHPEADPHGDPIPSPSGSMAASSVRRLSEWPTETDAVVTRIGNQDSAFLEFAAANGLTPGRRIRVEARDPHGDSVTVRHEGGTTTVGTAAADRVLVGPAPPPAR